VKRRLFYLPLLLLLLATGPAAAAKIYSIDPETGQTTIAETGEGEESATEEKPAYCPEDEKEIRRLREIVRRQQQSLLAQRALISQLREDLRRKENIIQGLDLLRRQGR
jgi:TolA-binding protein